MESIFTKQYINTKTIWNKLYVQETIDTKIIIFDHMQDAAASLPINLIFVFPFYLKFDLKNINKIT